MAAPVIYFNGMPGVGKLTVAKLVQARLQERNIRVGVIDNHSIIDPVAKKHPRNKPAEFQAARTEYRRAILRPISNDPVFQDMVFLFTDCAREYNDSVRDHAEMAKGSGRRFFSVVLSCDEEENQKRIVMPGRGKPYGNSKQKSAGCVRYAYREGKSDTFRFGGRDELVLETTKLSAEETADRVAAWFDGRQSESGEELEDRDSGICESDDGEAGSKDGSDSD